MTATMRGVGSPVSASTSRNSSSTPTRSGPEERSDSSIADIRVVLLSGTRRLTDEPREQRHVCRLVGEVLGVPLDTEEWVLRMFDRFDGPVFGAGTRPEIPADGVHRLMMDAVHTD